MPFVIEDPEETETVGAVGAGSNTFVISEPEDESFSPLRAIGGAAQKAIGGLFKGPELIRGLGGKLAQTLMGMSPEETQNKLLEKGYSPEETDAIVQQLYESTPISQTLTDVTGGQLEARHPLERVLQEGAETAGEFVGLDALLFGAGGAGQLGKAAISGGLFGTGAGTAKEAGAGGLGQFASGVAASTLPGLIKGGISKIIDYGKELFTAKRIPTTTPKFLEESLTPAAKADLELSNKDLVGRIAQTSKEDVAKFEDLVGKVTEPAFEESGTFRARDIERDINLANRNSLLNTISPSAGTKKESWEAVQEVVDNNFKAAKAAYRELYDTAEAEAATITSSPSNLFEESKKLKSEMRGSLLEIAEEGNIKSAAENLVKRLIPSQVKDAQRLVADLAEEGIIADYESVLKMLQQTAEKGTPRQIPVDQLMKTKRSINRILSKSDILPAPVDLLKPLSRAIKKDIVEGLAQKPGALQNFVAAESAFAKTMDVFGSDAMKKARKSQNPEELSTFFTSPSNLKKLKQATGSERKAADLIDRLVVDQITKKTRESAQDLASESRKYISDKANKSMEKLIEYGDTKTPVGAREVTRSTLLNDLQKSISDGARPQVALDLMQNPSGYKLVRDTLNTSKSGRQMFKSLQEMTMRDMMDSIIDKGTKQINYDSARDIFQNKHLRQVVKDTLGEDGLKFFEGLEKKGNNLYQNLQNLKTKEPKFFKQLLDTYLGSKFKAIFAAFMPSVGVPLLLVGEGAARISRRALFKTIENGESRKVLNKLMQPNTSTEQTKRLIKRFGQIASKLDYNDE